MSVKRDTGKRYPVSMLRRAREHREAGWSIYSIRGFLEDEFGEAPHETSILRWVDEGYRRAHIAVQNARREQSFASEAKFKLQGKSEAYCKAFVQRLAAQGVRPADISRVTAVVLPEQIGEDRVRYLLSKEPGQLDRRRRENRVAA